MKTRRHMHVWALTWLVFSTVLALDPRLPVEARIAGAHSAQPGAAHAQQRTPSREARATDTYGSLPLRFEENVGQTDDCVQFLARGRGYTLFLTPSEAIFSLNVGTQPMEPELDSDAFPNNRPRTRAVLRMGLIGANPEPDVAGDHVLSGRTNYFIGNDPSRWRTDVRSYASVRYREVYDGVDLVYYDNGGQLEYDFVVAPGADPREIRLSFDGAESIEIDANGGLVLRTAAGEVRQHPPVLYQETDRGRVNVAGGYEFRSGGAIGFGFASYDRNIPLVIDPILVYATYLGGGGIEAATKIAVDASGAAYIVGQTDSMDFPTMGFDPTANGGIDVFVTKLNAAGNGLVYSTYLGGSSSDGGVVGNPSAAIAVDNAGAAYVAGRTDSSDFPTVNAFDTTLGGSRDAFVTKLSAAGNSLVYSTYLGGGNADEGYAIAVDALGAAYVTGYTSSANFPTIDAFDTTFGGIRDAFVTKLKETGDSLVYSTFIGGGGEDRGIGVVVDAAGTAYVAGHTSSFDFPTASAFDTTLGGSQDVFVTKLSAVGNTLVYSTYLGGSDSDGHILGAIAVDTEGSAYVTSRTFSSDFPTANAFDATLGGSVDAFVTKLSAAGDTLVYSTFLGGTETEFGEGVAVDASGAAYVCGFTGSSDFPTAAALDTTLDGPTNAFVTKLGAAGTTLVYSTYLGGTGNDDLGAGDYGYSIAVDTTGAAYVAGQTTSSDFPTTPGRGAALGTSRTDEPSLATTMAGAFDTTLGGLADGFVVKLSDSSQIDTAGIYDSATGMFFLRNSNSSGVADLTFTFGVGNAGYSPLAGDWDGDGIDTVGLYDPATGTFFLRNGNSPGPADLTFMFGVGNAGYTPVAGDWNGDGIDTIGLYNSASGVFFLKNTSSSGVADLVVGYGPAGQGWIPLAGDWNSDGTDTIGLYDPTTGFFFLKNTNTPGTADLTFGFGPGGQGWLPLAGDYSGDQVDTVGVYSPSNGVFFLKNTNTAGPADLTFGYGAPNAAPLIADWDGV